VAFRCRFGVREGNPPPCREAACAPFGVGARGSSYQAQPPWSPRTGDGNNGSCKSVSSLRRKPRVRCATKKSTTRANRIEQAGAKIGTLYCAPVKAGPRVRESERPCAVRSALDFDCAAACRYCGRHRAPGQRGRQSSRASRSHIRRARILRDWPC